MLGLVIGTRPDIIKMAPLIRRCPDAKVIHTGQHYSPELDSQLRDEYGIVVDYRLQIDPQGGVADNYARMSQVDLWELGVSSVVVYGDTLSASAVALAAVRQHVSIIHLEAGLRSRNLSMPEEVARIMIDASSDLLLAPTERQVQNLEAEGIDGEIAVVGNLVQDVLEPWHQLKREPGKYALLTLHRRENLLVLEKLIAQAAETCVELGLKLVVPAHPFVGERIAAYAKRFGNMVEVIEPLSHHPFLELMINSAFVMTDSGGLQEETAILGIPCVTLRTTTERPETLDCGWNMLWHPETHDLPLMGLVVNHLEQTEDLPKFRYCKGQVIDQVEAAIRKRCPAL